MYRRTKKQEVTVSAQTSGHVIASRRQRPRVAVGPVALAAVIGMFVLQWLAGLTKRGDHAVYLGQALGSVSVTLMSLSLVLVSLAPQLEGHFGGLDKVILWHKRLSIAGALLVIAHIPLATAPDTRTGLAALGIVSAVGLLLMIAWSVGPRAWAALDRSRRLPRPGRLTGPGPGSRRVGRLANYDYWRLLHRISVAVLVTSAVHGATASTLYANPMLRWSYLAMAVPGLVAYAYHEAFGRAGYDYRVSDLTVAGGGVTHLELSPTGSPLRHTPGQFALLSFPGGLEARRHPFTITSSPAEPVLRFSIKALGDFTSQLPRRLCLGSTVTVRGPHGRMDHTQGTPTQIWIAAGIGVTPFIGWLRSLDQYPAVGTVHFFYSTRNRNSDPFVTEIEQISSPHPEITLQIIETGHQPHLTPHDVIGATAGRLRQTSVYMAGPPGMQRSMRRGLVRAGLRPQRFHTEHFTWR